MDPLENLIREETREHITGAIRLLPETERLIFRMRSVEGFSESDTAACTMLSTGKVRRALARANALLRQRLVR